MIRKLMLVGGVAATLAAAVAGFAQAQGRVEAYVSAAVADKGRPAADVARDADRKPAEMLAFAGVKPGMAVADLFPGGGYFTRIFSKAVGPKGVVYGVGPVRAGQKAIGEVLAADGYDNVKSVVAPAGSFQTPAPVDVVWTSQNYHDIKNTPNIDMVAFDKQVFAALKPGGVFIVLDHVANPGDPNVTRTFHRVDPAVVKQEVTAAGFRFEGESTVLRNPKDDHSKGVFDPTFRGHTDQFIYKFRKPK